MKKFSLIALLTACALLLSCAALAETDYEFDASVVCVHPSYVTAAIGGTVGDVAAMTGQLVTSGDMLVSLRTTKVYASIDGVITGLFCEPGDSVSAVTDHYGALMYIEPSGRYTLTASTDNAYSAAENKYIHTGETVYLSCSDGKHTGTGLVTGVDGTNFTVEVTSGTFYMEETVSVYRDSAYTTKSRIGKGDIERIANIAVTGSSSSTSSSASMGGGGESSGDSASVAAVCVSDGDTVKAGDLLLETLSGEYDAYYYTGNELVSTVDGILASLNASVGGTVSKGDVIATVYPFDALQLKVEVNEADLAALTEGTEVEITFNWNEDSDEAVAVKGTVATVLYSSSASENSEVGEMGASAATDSAAYTAYIDFAADNNVRIGMTAIVRPIVAAEPEEEIGEVEENG